MSCAVLFFFFTLFFLNRFKFSNKKPHGINNIFIYQFKMIPVFYVIFLFVCLLYNVSRTNKIANLQLKKKFFVECYWRHSAKKNQTFIRQAHRIGVETTRKKIECSIIKYWNSLLCFVLQYEIRNWFFALWKSTFIWIIRKNSINLRCFRSIPRKNRSVCERGLMRGFSLRTSKWLCMLT